MPRKRKISEIAKEQVIDQTKDDHEKDETELEINSEKIWEIQPALASMRLTNPIRDIVDLMKKPNIPDKPLISLSIGDPTVFGNFQNPDNINEALIKNVQTRKYNGYAHSAGYVESRSALAKYFSIPGEYELTADDVFLGSGGSGALELCFTVLLNPGDSILLPAPGFSFYLTLCEYKGFVPKFYRLLPEKNWEIDLNDLESQIDKTTKAILLNNPSNPCGSVYSKEHLLDLLKVAEKHRIPIISDEIYSKMVFQGHVFYPLGSLSTSVPVLAVGGFAKVYLAPGWRFGWIVVYDKKNLMKQVKVGLTKLTQIILGPNTLVQSVVEEALFGTKAGFYQETADKLQKNANYLVEHLSKIQGLKVVKPGGAMYMMVGINTHEFRDIANDLEFAMKLLQEENVFVLPGKIFRCENFVRLVICPPPDKLEIACKRIQEFCFRHRK